MGISFDHHKKVLLINNKNPHEATYFRYSHEAIPYPGTCVVSYLLEGDIPSDISINSQGIISGNILYLGYQSSCIPYNKQNLEVEADGSNWNENGRFEPLYFDFIFTVICNWRSISPDGTPCSIPGVTLKNTIIRVVKDHDFDNQIWINKYSKVKGIKVNINNTKEVP